MQRLSQGFVAVVATGVLSVLLSACGGDDGSSAVPTATSTPGRTPIALIPTWTPVPTNTQPPPPTPTPEATPTAPTTQPGTTGNPSTPQPGDGSTLTTTTGQATPIAEAGPNPTLNIPVEALNSSIARALGDAVGQSLVAAPTVRFDSGQVVIEGVVIDTSGGARTETAVTVRANLLQIQGQPVLAVTEAFYTQDDTPYEGELAGAHLDAIEDVLQEIVDEQYAALRPNDDGYYIVSITVGDAAISLQTVSLTP